MDPIQDTAGAPGGEPVSLDIDAAVSILNTLDQPKPKEEPSAPPAEAKEEEQPSSPEPDTGEQAEITDPSSAGDEPTGEEDPPELETREPPKVRLRDGREVTVAELKKGYLDPEEYTRKTQEVETQRKQVEARLAQTAQQEQLFKQVLPLALTVLKSQIPDEPDRSLLESDPIEFQRLHFVRNEKIREFQNLRGAFMQQSQKAQADAEAAREAARKRDEEQLSAYVQEQNVQLLERLPELKDREKATAFMTDIVNTAKAYGFSDEEAGNVYDHRLLLMAKDAASWRRLQSQKPKAIEKAKGAAPMQAPGHRQAPSDASRRSIREGLSALSKNPNSDEVAVQILNRLG